MYGDAPQGGGLMPMVIAGRNPSNTIDKQYTAGYLWLSSLDIRNSNGTTGSGNLYYQGGNVAGTPSWTLVSNSGGVLNTLSDGVTTVSPLGGNIALVGVNSNQIVVTASAPTHELILSIPNTFIAPGSIASTTTMTVGSDLTVVGDATIGDDLVVTDDASIGGDLTVTGTITLGGLAVNGTVTVNTVGAGTTTIGNAAAGAITIDVGTGNFALNGGGNTVGIANDGAANLVTVGSTTGVAALTLQAGTGDMLLTGAVTTAITIGSITQTGPITLGRSTAGQNINIGSAINASAQVISIANGASAANSTVNILSGIGTAGVGTLALGNNTRVTVAGLADIAPAASRTVTVGGGTVVVAAVTDTIDIGPDGATTNANSVKTVNVNTGGVTTGQVLTNIASGAVTSGTHTTSIASGNRAAGTMALNLMTGTGTKTATLGNADGLTTFNLLGVSNLNASQNSNTNINTGTSTGTVAIGNSLATAITLDAVAFSIDGTAASNVTVTGAGIDLLLDSSGGSVLVRSTEDAALAIRLHANGGTSETIQIHSDQGTGVASIGLLSDVGGITLRSSLATGDAINIEANGNVASGLDIDAGTAGVIVDTTGAVSLDSAAASNFTVTGAFALTLESSLGAVIVNSGLDAAESIYLHANAGVSETIRIRSDQGTSATSVDIESDVGGISLVAGLSAANAIVINASGAAGGIDLTTGGGSIDLSSTGLVTMVAATDTQASPSATTAAVNKNVGAATFTGFTTASSGTQTFTITNSLVSATSQLFVSIANEGANDARMQIQRVKRLAGTFEVYTVNAGAAALNGNLTITWWLIG